MRHEARYLWVFLNVEKENFDSTKRRMVLEYTVVCASKRPVQRTLGVVVDVNERLERCV